MSTCSRRWPTWGVHVKGHVGYATFKAVYSLTIYNICCSSWECFSFLRFTKPFKCLVCQKEFLTWLRAEEHMETHISERRYKCGECGKQLKLTRTRAGTHESAFRRRRPYHCSSVTRDTRPRCGRYANTVLGLTLSSLHHRLLCSRMLCRSTTALMARTSLTCVRTAPVASGKRAL